MANESKKDFNAMLHDSKDMPKIQTVTDPKTIEKYGGTRMYFAPPIDYDKIMRQVPYGKVVTIGGIREHFAKRNGADFTEPVAAGIFVSIAACLLATAVPLRKIAKLSIVDSIEAVE